MLIVGIWAIRQRCVPSMMETHFAFELLLQKLGVNASQAQNRTHSGT